MVFTVDLGLFWLSGSDVGLFSGDHSFSRDVGCLFSGLGCYISLVFHSGGYWIDSFQRDVGWVVFIGILDGCGFLRMTD
jgi:hypothetical protein